MESLCPLVTMEGSGDIRLPLGSVAVERHMPESRAITGFECIYRTIIAIVGDGIEHSIVYAQWRIRFLVVDVCLPEQCSTSGVQCRNSSC